MLIKKLPDVSVLVNTKISKCKNKIPVVSDLVKKTDNDNKIRKYISISDYNKFTKEMLDARIKEKELVK